MKTKFKTILAFTLMVAFAGVAAAQPGNGMRQKARADRWDHRGPGFGIQQMFELGMSDKQIQKVMKIYNSHLEDAIPRQREHYELRKQLRELQADPKVNEAKINEITARFQEMKTIRETEMKKVQDEVWNVLTAEQQKQLGQDALFPHFGDGFPGNGPGLGMGPGFGPGPAAPGMGPGPFGPAQPGSPAGPQKP